MPRALSPLLLVLAAFSSTAWPVVAQEPPAASPVEVETVESREFTPTASLLGTTEPRRRSVVAASIEGHVVDFAVDEGMRVKAGTILARLRDTVLRLQLREAEAALEEIREKHANARRDLERARKLTETDVLTERDLDSRATLEKTLALQVPQAEARVEIIKADIAKKAITAPFAGQIVREHTEVGEWLARGGEVVTLVDISSVFVRVNVPERYVRFLDENEMVQLWVAAAGDRPFLGRVVSISDEGDPDSRTFPVRVEVKREGELRAGMSARVELPSGRSRRGVVVSKDAILLRGTQSYVFVVGEDERAERREVTTGPATGSMFAVLDGLREGEKVVVKGNERIQPGAPLRIVEGEEPKLD